MLLKLLHWGTDSGKCNGHQYEVILTETKPPKVLHLAHVHENIGSADVTRHSILNILQYILLAGVMA